LEYLALKKNGKKATQKRSSSSAELALSSSFLKLLTSFYIPPPPSVRIILGEDAAKHLAQSQEAQDLIQDLP
jgi:hypothetical protein